MRNPRAELGVTAPPLIDDAMAYASQWFSATACAEALSTNDKVDRVKKNNITDFGRDIFVRLLDGTKTTAREFWRPAAKSDIAGRSPTRRSKLSLAKRRG